MQRYRDAVRISYALKQSVVFGVQEFRVVFCDNVVDDSCACLLIATSVFAIAADGTPMHIKSSDYPAEYTWVGCHSNQIDDVNLRLPTGWVRQREV